MQNNPFNLFSQLQSAGAAPNSQENSGQSGWNNAALVGAMQNMLARGGSNLAGNVLGSLPGALPGAVSGMGHQSWPSKPTTGSDQSADMNIFRQFQLQQNQPPPPQVSGAPQRAAGIPATAASGGVQGSTGAWNNPSMPGWNNPQLAAAPAVSANTSSVPAAANNQMMNAMVQSFLTQQMAVQQAQQPNPMAGYMQMMQTMMPLAALMPNMGAQMPNTDPNMTKQLIVQLIGQLQNAGQLGNDDSLQKLLQQASGSSAQGAETLNAPPSDVISIQPDGSGDQLADEVMDTSEIGTAVPKKGGKGVKGKTAGSGNIGAKVKPGPAVAKMSENRGLQNKKQTDLSFDAGRKETDKKSSRTSLTKSEPRAQVGRKAGPQSRSSEASKKVPDLVMVDSDEDDNASTNSEMRSASESSSVAEENKGKRGRGRVKTKTQEKQTKKSTNAASKSILKGTDHAKSSVPEFPLRRIKIEDANEDEPFEGLSRSPRRGKTPTSEKTTEIGMAPQIKTEYEPDVKPSLVPPGMKLKRCEVRLEILKRDVNGKFIVPFSPSPKKSAGGVKTAAVFKAEPATPIYSEPVFPRRRGSPGYARDDQPTPLKVQLLPNLNAVVHPQMRTIFVGHLNGNMQWLSLVGWAASQSFCQCPFCPILSDTPKGILSHIRVDHADLTFALTKMKPPVGKFLYLFCRHCDFVAFDVTINWLHFEVYHNVSDILEGTARPRFEDFAPAKLEIRRCLEDIMDTSQSYMCYDCELISDDSKQVAIHVLHEHHNTPHYNGCFVKLLGLRRPLKSEHVSYKRIVSDDEFTEFRQEAFICMMCDYIAHCPYMALSHNLITHQTKRVLFDCTEAGCTFNCINDHVMVQHLSSVHKLKTDLCCSTTLLEPRVEGYVECVIAGNRKTSKQASLQRCGGQANANATTNGNAARISPVVFTSDEESEDEADEETGEPKKKKRSGKAKGKEDSNSSEKTSKDGNSSSADEDESVEEDKLPDDVKITINPLSPDEMDEAPNSPGSDDSGDTIVDDPPNNDDPVDKEPTPGEDGAEHPSTSNSDDDAEDGTDNGKDKADNAVSGSRDEQLTGTAATNEDKVSTKDFITDIPLEPCCLSPDIYLPVPSTDICTFDSAPDMEGAGSERPQQLNTPEKDHL